MRIPGVIGRVTADEIVIQPVGWCPGCGRTMPLVGVVQWPADVAEILGEPLSSGQCQGCSSTLAATRVERVR